MSYSEWLKTYARVAKGEQVACPDCGHEYLRAVAVAAGESKARTGWGVLWCDFCHRGIRLSRLDPIARTLDVLDPDEVELKEITFVEAERRG